MTTWGAGGGASCVPRPLYVTSMLRAPWAGNGSATVWQPDSIARLARSHPNRETRPVFVTTLLERYVREESGAEGALVECGEARSPAAAAVLTRERRLVGRNEPGSDDDVELGLAGTHGEPEPVVRVQSHLDRYLQRRRTARDQRDPVDTVRRRSIRLAVLELRWAEGELVDAIGARRQRDRRVLRRLDRGEIRGVVAEPHRELLTAQERNEVRIGGLERDLEDDHVGEVVRAAREPPRVSRRGHDPNGQPRRPGARRFLIAAGRGERGDEDRGRGEELSAAGRHAGTSRTWDP